MADEAVLVLKLVQKLNHPPPTPFYAIRTGLVRYDKVDVCVYARQVENSMYRIY
jgi:hypothetical protein